MLFDTEFVISLSRRPDSAQRKRTEVFLKTQRPKALYVSCVTTCEVATGCMTRSEVDALLAPFTPIEIGTELAWHASRVARNLKGLGLHIGDNDVWIAATALAYRLPLVSNNARHFARVDGLKLLGY